MKQEKGKEKKKKHNKTRIKKNKTKQGISGGMLLRRHARPVAL